MKVLLVISMLITNILSCKNKQDLDISNTNNKTELRTRYTFSQGKEADFGTSTGTYFILYDYSIPVDTFYQKAFPLGKDSLLYIQLMHFKINDHDFGGYSQAVKMELRIYDGEKTHTLSLPLFSTHMSNFTLHDYTIYYWGFTDQMYACSYNLKTKKHTQIRLGPSVGTDFDGVYNEPQVDDNGIVTFTLWDDENTNWTISTNGKKILSFTQKNRKLKNYDEYLKVVEKENEEAYQSFFEE